MTGRGALGYPSVRMKLRYALLAAASTLSTRILLACPLCGENMSNDVYGKDPTQLGRGFFWSIIFMVVLPFATVATVGLRIYLAKRKRDLGTAAGNAAAPEASS